MKPESTKGAIAKSAPVATSHVITGKVKSVGEDYGRKTHVRVEIEHGRSAADKKGSDGKLMSHSGAGRMLTSVTIPKEHAIHYPVGSNAQLTLAPAPKGTVPAGPPMKGTPKPTAQTTPLEVPSKISKAMGK